MSPSITTTARVSVITGATSGIGRVAAAGLARRGDVVILVGRDQARGQATLDQLVTETGSQTLSFLAADLSAMAEVRRLADTIRARHDRIDLLVNNAGALFQRRQDSVDGLELTFALNHLAYFLLSDLLTGPLQRSGAGRVVSVASAAHRRAVLDLDDLPLARGYSGWRAYQRSKLANILFTRGFARRYTASGIIATCLHPGFVATRFGDANGGLFALALGAAKRLFAESAETGGERILFLATTPDPEPGGYYVRNRPAIPAPEARSDAAADRLWQISLDLTRRWRDSDAASNS
jgi:NAD(P)-dependent dehydrogenase (short-subunit alcohol dehydrogenase family)